MTAAHHLTAVLAVGVARLSPANRIAANSPNAASIVAIERRPLNVDIRGPVSANSAHSAKARRTGQIDPELPFKIGRGNGREARQSGLSVDASCAGAALPRRWSGREAAARLPPLSLRLGLEPRFPRTELRRRRVSSTAVR
jgi:hypothetical protein